MLDFKKEFINALLGLGLVLLLWFIIVFGQLKLYQIILLSCAVSLGLHIWQEKFSLRKLITNWLVVIAVILFFQLLSRFGWKGYVASIGASTALILYWKWKPYLQAKQHIETLIWGKPLKEYIKNKEIPPKLKII